MNPLEKLGFVNTSRGFVEITNIGWDLINGTISYSEAMNLQVQQWKYIDEGANIKLFIAILHLIEEINSLYSSADGISISEFRLFGMTINNYKDISNHIMAVDSYRKDQLDPRKLLRTYSNYYNYDDYLDNNVKYMKTSTFLVVNNGRITFNYNRKAAIDNILKTDDGRAY
ncbi:AlwI family type II restriction endonuclease [Alkaliphilus sp. MSJ-5]|uniref:AlwI family type II restriction endonuclease n=1 Tax=Alkaliphilus flagellatus TaxID=2841507 RepID=A0ABS6G3U3_9FIRM|nr:AlwI family type II restriction endonuclease [Alkaliphilus flagellatus]MBU5676811.1 AlwI family type II restriction endonuclease [Alkaliphilus flagellatus]